MTHATHIFRDPPTDPEAPRVDIWRRCTATEAMRLHAQGFEVRESGESLVDYGTVWVDCGESVGG